MVVIDVTLVVLYVFYGYFKVVSMWKCILTVEKTQFQVRLVQDYCVKSAMMLLGLMPHFTGALYGDKDVLYRVILAVFLFVLIYTEKVLYSIRSEEPVKIPMIKEELKCDTAKERQALHMLTVGDIVGVWFVIYSLQFTHLVCMRYNKLNRDRTK